MFCKKSKIETKYSPLRLHTGTWAVEFSIKTLNSLIISKSRRQCHRPKSMDRALKVMRVVIHTGPQVSPFEPHHGRKPKTELTDGIEDNKSYLCDWTTLNMSVPPNQITIYLARKEK